jgi:hypothetical protein
MTVNATTLTRPDQPRLQEEITMSITATGERPVYDEGTASMLVDPEAPPTGGDASEAVPGTVGLRRAEAACSGTGDLEWVPEVERHIVPDPMRQLCRRCTGRARCLRWAILTRSEGYWACTTTADRIRLVAEGPVTVARADAIQAALRAEAAASAALNRAAALHRPGEGSLWWYRHHCRCAECRRHNAARGARDRTRTRRAAAAA